MVTDSHRVMREVRFEVVARENDAAHAWCQSLATVHLEYAATKIVTGYLNFWDRD